MTENIQRLKEQLRKKPEVKKGGGVSNFLVEISKVPLKEKAYFYHLLAEMVDAGVPLMQAVETLSSRSQSEKFRRVLIDIAESLRKGVKLSSSFSRFADLFKEMEIGVIKAGEAAGNLAKVLFRLAEEINRANNLRIKLFSAATYPIFVLIVLFLATIGMLIWVVPSLLNLLYEAGVKFEDFPVVSKILLGMSEVVVNYWLYGLFLGLIGYFLFSIWINSEEGKYRFDLWKLNFPVIGELRKKLLIQRFVSNFGMLVDSGVSVIYGLAVVAEGMQNSVYTEAIDEIRARVVNGEKITDVMEEMPFLFPGELVRILQTGEQTATLGKVCAKISKQYELEIDNSFKSLISLFEPIMLLTVGLIVGLMAVAILLPIFSLTTINNFS